MYVEVCRVGKCGGKPLLEFFGRKLLRCLPFCTSNFTSRDADDAASSPSPPVCVVVVRDTSTAPLSREVIRRIAAIHDHATLYL